MTIQRMDNVLTMLRTPDGHGRVELTRFHTPPREISRSLTAPRSQWIRVVARR